LIKNSQPFGKKFQNTVEGDFFDSHCMTDSEKRKEMITGRNTIIPCSTDEHTQ